MDETSASKSSTETVSDPRESRKPLRIVSAAWLLFALFLIGLAVLTANPVLVNERQLANSDAVIRGEITASRPESVTLRVIEVLKGELERETIVVRGFHTKNVSEGEEWVVPVIEISSAEYLLTPLNRGSEQEMEGIIYRADPETLNILDSHLSSEEISP